MPFKAKKRLFSALELYSPLLPSETPLTEVRIISSSVSSFSFGQGEKEIEEEEEAVAKTEATAALFQRMELNEPIKRTKM